MALKLLLGTEGFQSKYYKFQSLIIIWFLKILSYGDFFGILLSCGKLIIFVSSQGEVPGKWLSKNDEVVDK